MAVAPAQFGDPVTGTTSYEVCIYDAADRLKGAYTVARAGDLCGRLSCWSTISARGYRYTDKSRAADGILAIRLSGGDSGKGKVQILGKSSSRGSRRRSGTRPARRFSC